MDNEYLEQIKTELYRLSYEVFVVNPDGAKLLDLLEKGIVLHTTIANPAKDASYAFYNEGRCSVIRMLRHYAAGYHELVKFNSGKKYEKET